VVGGERAQLAGKLRCATAGELVGMELDREAVRTRRRQDHARLRDREHAGLAEDVRVAGESFTGDGGKHLVNEEVDVLPAPGVATVTVLVRDLVRAQPGGDDAHRQCVGKALDDPQRPELVGQRQTIPRLHLHRRDARRREGAQAGQRQRIQLVVGARAQVADRGVDPSPAPRDLHVRDAGGTLLLLLVARATEDGVRVRVDESRGEHSAFAVYHVGARARGRGGEGGLRAHLHDLPFLHQDPCTRQDTRIPHLGADPGTGGSGAGDHLRGIDEKQPVRHQAVGCGRPITSSTREKRNGAWASPRQA